jgi:excinuclease ABC subunit C
MDEANLLTAGTTGVFLAGIAKARTIKEETYGEKSVVHSSERLFLPHAAEALLLEPHTYERYLIERIRDEAHRFAITAHRRGRSTRTLKSELISLPGIGKKRAVALLRHFGSVRSLREANPAAVAGAIHISVKKAEELLALLTHAPHSN